MVLNATFNNISTISWLSFLLVEETELPVQSALITTNVVSSNLDQDEMHNFMWYSLSVTCDKSVVFSR